MGRPLETSNWFTSTHPRSPFVTSLIASIVAADGSRTVLSDWSGGLTLADQTPSGAIVTPVERTDVPQLLATRFGLSGYAIGADGRLAPPAAT